jgi:hypothetical protein
MDSQLITQGAKALLESGVLAIICAFQMGVIIWLVNKLLAAIDRQNTAFQHNTTAFNKLILMLEDRPCLAGDRTFKNKDSERLVG